jgi:hypothetical protein
MLSVIVNNEKQLNFKNDDYAIEGYVLEVLHREFLNINDENIAQYEQNGSDSLLLKLQQHKQQKQQLQQQQEFLNQEQQAFTNISNSNKQQITTVNNTRPQIIKLQSFQTAPSMTPVTNTNMITSTTPQNVTNSPNVNAKPIIYVSQSPVKNQIQNSNTPKNKLVKFTSNPTQQIIQNPNNTINPNNILQKNNTLNGANSMNMNQAMIGGGKNGNGSVLLLNDLKNTIVQQDKVFNRGEFLDEKGGVVVLQQQNNQQQQQQVGQQFQDQQVLSLVVLTDNSNGGVSYLSLVPQN